MTSSDAVAETVGQSDAIGDPLTWWRDARFGMFIHWGLYSVAAGVYRGEQIPSLGEWIRATARIPFDEYAEFASGLTLDRYDPDRWLQLARDAGMRYLVITAKHHDGFAMFRTKASPFNIVEATPYGQDPMVPLAEACRKHGVQLCFYYSQALDWEDPNGGVNPPVGTMDGHDFAKYLETKVKTQLRELLTQYGRIGLIWFDTPAHISPDQSADLAAYVKSIQPECLVSGRIGHDMGDYGSLGDNQIPAGKVEGDWETPATMNDTWGFKQHDHNWKPTGLMIKQLVGLAGKGVNFLLNVGPDAHGALPQPIIERLEEIGRWVGPNQAAIHGTRATPYPYDFAWGAITRKPGKLYLLITDWPDKAFSLMGLRNRVTHARLLGGGARSIPFRQRRDADHDIDTLVLDLPSCPSRDAVNVIELDIEGEAVVDQRLVQQPDGSVTLPAHMAELRIGASGESARLAREGEEADAAKAGESQNQAAAEKLSVGSSGLIEHWHSLDDSASWRFYIAQPGVFRVRIQTVAEKYKPWQGGHAVRVALGDQSIDAPIADGAAVAGDRQSYFEERATELGRVQIDEAGEAELLLRATAINSELPAGLVVSQITLEAAE